MKNVSKEADFRNILERIPVKKGCYQYLEEARPGDFAKTVIEDSSARSGIIIIYSFFTRRKTLIA